jgi:hypothetical protein
VKWGLVGAGSFQRAATSARFRVNFTRNVSVFDSQTIDKEGNLGTCAERMRDGEPKNGGAENNTSGSTPQARTLNKMLLEEVHIPLNLIWFERDAKYLALDRSLMLAAAQSGRWMFGNSSRTKQRSPLATPSCILTHPRTVRTSPKATTRIIGSDALTDVCFKFFGTQTARGAAIL